MSKVNKYNKGTSTTRIKGVGVEANVMTYKGVTTTMLCSSEETRGVYAKSTLCGSSAHSVYVNAEGVLVMGTHPTRLVGEIDNVTRIPFNPLKVTGDVFIIPNELVLPDKHLMKSLGGQMKLAEDSMLVEVWAANDENENWSSHRYLTDNPFPSYLPLEMFKDKKEGDSVTFMWHYTEITLTLNTKDHRYSNNGLWEDLVASLKVCATRYYNVTGDFTMEDRSAHDITMEDRSAHKVV